MTFNPFTMKNIALVTVGIVLTYIIINFDKLTSSLDPGVYEMLYGNSNVNVGSILISAIMWGIILYFIFHKDEDESK